MAMTPGDPPLPAGGDGMPGDAGASSDATVGDGAQIDDTIMHQAVTELRSRADARWVEVSDRILRKAMTATRQSRVIRATTPGGPVHVSEQVLITYLRDALEPVRGCALSYIDFTVEDEVCTGIFIELIAQYGRPLLPIADQVRDLAATTLRALLGPDQPAVTISIMRVHYGDVSIEDPNPR